MGLFGFTRTKKRGTTLTDDARELSIQTRKQNAEIRQRERELEMQTLELKHEIKMSQLQLEKEQLYDRLREYVDDDEEEPLNEDEGLNSMLLKLIMGKMATGNNSTSTPTQYLDNPVASIPSPTPLTTDLNEEQLLEIWNNIPKKQQKAISKLSESTLRSLIPSQFGNVTEATTQRALKIIKQ